MSDLPSRERMKPLAKSLRRYVENASNDALVEEIVVPIEARASGRLVDREAIDYEAAKQALNEDGRWLVAPDIIEIEADHMVRLVVDAAIGGGE